MRGLLVAMTLGFGAAVFAQPPNATIGEAVPRDVRELYDKGLQYLAKTQTDQGNWTGGQGGPGVTGLGLMAFLASGEDPNFGIYSNNVRRAVRALITGQDGSTGFYGSSMYDHGFAMLAMAEAYGVVDDRQVWPDGKGPRSIGVSLELAVRAALTSQRKNPLGAGAIRLRRPMRILRSAVRSSSACSPRAMPASKSPTMRSTGPSVTTRA